MNICIPYTTYHTCFVSAFDQRYNIYVQCMYILCLEIKENDYSACWYTVDKAKSTCLKTTTQLKRICG